MYHYYLTVLTSHIATVLSAEQVATVLTYGKKCTALIESTCPRNVSTHFPLEKRLKWIAYRLYNYVYLTCLHPTVYMCDPFLLKLVNLLTSARYIPKL